MDGTANKHFCTVQPPFSEGIIEDEVPGMDPPQSLGWEENCCKALARTAMENWPSGCLRMHFCNAAIMQNVYDVHELQKAKNDL